MAKKMSTIDVASWVGCTLAGLHVGLIGAFNYNIFDSLLGAGSMITKVLFIVIGLLALYSVWHMITCAQKK